MERGGELEQTEANGDQSITCHSGLGRVNSGDWRLRFDDSRAKVAFAPDEWVLSYCGWGLNMEFGVKKDDGRQNHIKRRQL